MTERNHATIGDALIFITKGIGVTLAVAVLIASVAGGFWWHDHSYYAELKVVRAELQAAKNVRDLDNASLSDLRAELKERASKIVDKFCQLGGMRDPESAFVKRWQHLQIGNGHQPIHHRHPALSASKSSHVCLNVLLKVSGALVQPARLNMCALSLRPTRIYNRCLPA